ncbi:hypothetical protein ES703_56560 [subsurface metagenome]
MKAKIFYLTMALVMALALVAVAAPVVGPGDSPVQAANTSLDGRTWYYWNDPGGDGCHEGGLGQSSGDTSKDSSGALESVGGVLQWTFNGSAGIAAGSEPCPHSGGCSFYDLILPLYGEDWSDYKAIKFDVKTTSTGGPSSRDRLRIIVRLDEKVGDGDYFPALNYSGAQYGLYSEHEVWSAHKLEVGHNGGWSTFELNFDKVKDARGGFWASPSQYDVGNKWAYGTDVNGDTREDRDIYIPAGNDWDGIIDRDNLMSFRFTIWMCQPQWIAYDEDIIVYFDNIELVPAEEGNGGDGCFIATAAYGTSTAAEIDTLRAFRDEVLLENGLGSQLVAFYYDVSPPVADFISEHDVLRTLVRELLVEPVAWVVEATGTLWGN